MRTSRMQGKPPRKRRKFPSFVIIAIVLGVAAYFIGAGAAGGWLAENVIEPVFNSSDANAAPTQTPTSAPPQESISSIDIAEMTGDRIEENITADKLSLYTLQVGAFSDSENANKAANEVIARGGAGYVAYDGELYRVLIAGYTDREDASDVKQNLLESDVESSLFILESGSLEFVIGADQAQVDAVKACFDVVPETVASLQQVIYDFDNGKDVTEDLKTLHQNAQDILSQLDAAVETDDGAMKDLHAFMQDLSNALEELNPQDVDFSSDLKYNLIGIVVRYSSFLDELSD